MPAGKLSLDWVRIVRQFGTQEEVLQLSKNPKTVSNRDLELITSQIGRSPRGVEEIVTRCPWGAPQVIKNTPVLIDQERPSEQPRIFPTLYWLTCPELVRAVARLEAEGMVTTVQDRVERDPLLKSRLLAAHARYARQRMEMVKDTGWAKDYPQQFEVISTSGVAGIRGQGIKCLHTHCADFLAGNDNPVGELVHQELQQRGWLEIPSCCTCHWLLAVGKIGTNSCRFLTATISPQLSVQVSDEWVTETRLGEGVDVNHRLSDDAMIRTIDAVAGMAAEVTRAGAKLLRVTGTSALRDAANRGELVSRLRQRCGVELSVIDGKKEARLSFLGATSGMSREQAQTAVVVDIGGGSTEVMGGFGEVVLSLNVGAVRLTEQWIKTGGGLSGSREQWVKLTQFAADAVQKAAGDSLNRLREPLEKNLVGVGGTFTTLAAMVCQLREYDRESVNGTGLSREQITAIGERVFALPLDKRREIPGLVPTRADIITSGIAVALALLDQLSADQVKVSTNDMLVGMIIDWYQGQEMGIDGVCPK